MAATPSRRATLHWLNGRDFYDGLYDGKTFCRSEIGDG
ncbi:MAG: hypothetical protein QOJ24_4863, partial [Mycobacterium sp.]|nr:hypothetical protein [Mycobacterium sp.]